MTKQGAKRDLMLVSAREGMGDVEGGLESWLIRRRSYPPTHVGLVLRFFQLIRVLVHNATIVFVLKTHHSTRNHVDFQKARSDPVQASEPLADTICMR